MSDHLYLSADTKAHQLAMLYLESKYKNVVPSVETVMDDYKEVFNNYLKQLRGSSSWLQK